MFSKEDSRTIKGVALLMMIAHHLFTFHDHVPLGFSYSLPLFLDGPEVIGMLGFFCKLCVSMFLFISGYAICLTYQRKGNWDFAQTLKSCYLRYWLVFAVMIPIGFLFFREKPDYFERSSMCHVFDSFHTANFVLNFLGLKSTYNSEWWFFRIHLFTQVFGYAYILFTRKLHRFWLEFFVVLFLGLMFHVGFPALSDWKTLPDLSSNFTFRNYVYLYRTTNCFLMGILCSKYDGIARLRLLLQKYSPLVRRLLCIAGMVMLFFVYCYHQWGNEWLIVPILIALVLEFVDSAKFLRVPLAFLGRSSMTLCLTHTFFCYYFQTAVNWIYSTFSPDRRIPADAAADAGRLIADRRAVRGASPRCPCASGSGPGSGSVNVQLRLSAQAIAFPFAFGGI